MHNNKHNTTPQKLGFLLLPEFSMIAFSAAIEPLRIANRLHESPIFEWTNYSMTGKGVTASNGVTISENEVFSKDVDCDFLLVCAGLNPQNHLPTDMIAQLKQFARHNKPIGSVCTGSLALAAAGLLDDYRCTIHWENIEGFVEDYPDLDLTATVFEIDRDRYTCAGGTAPIDMMLYMIAEKYGESLANDTAEQMLHNYMRHPQEHQRMSLEKRMGIRHPKLLQAIGQMEAYTESPLQLLEVASSVNLSLRQLERLFQSTLKTTPGKYYLSLRLQRARLLLNQTTMSILQIAVATGFTSAAHFSKAYRAQYMHPPSKERRLDAKGT